MTNSISAAKRVRQAEKRRLYNQATKSKVRTLLKHFDEALASGEAQEAEEHFVKAASALDRAAARGVLHQNNAARHKSRMAKKMASLSS